MKYIAYVTDKAIAAFFITLIFILHIAGGCGEEKKGGNRVSSALDSLTEADLTLRNVEEASWYAAFIAGGTGTLHMASDFAPIVDNYWDCSQITNNSNYPTGTTIDVTWDAGRGCTVGTTLTYSGIHSIKGTIDVRNGSVNLTENYKNYGVADALTCPNSIGISITSNGSKSTSGNGLTNTSSSFNLSTNINIDKYYIVNAGCGLTSASGQGFYFVSGNESGSMSNNTWNMGESYTLGMEYYSELDAQKRGFYIENLNGTHTVGTQTISQMNYSAKIGWIDPKIGNGKVTIKIINAVFNPSICSSEPVSGTLEIVSGSHIAEVIFDGSSSTPCGCAHWTLDGKPQTSTGCWPYQYLFY